MQTLWDHRFAQRTQRMKSSAIRELLKLTEDPEIISFAGGFPAPDVFPVEEFVEACTKVLRENGATALQYGSTEGYNPTARDDRPPHLPPGHRRHHRIIS